jgi:hypothetical protein
MRRRSGVPLAPFLFLTVLLAPGLSGAAALAQGNVQARLTGVQEVPALSTDGQGLFMGQYSDDLERLAFALSYSDLEGAVAQAHLHLGQTSVNGGVSIFLCSNLGNGPPGTPLCPAPPAKVTGVLSAAEVIGPTGQGIAPGEWDEVRRAIAEGAVYANVHTDLFPGGEIRGQVTPAR